MTKGELLAHIEKVLAYLRSDVESYKVASEIGAGPYLLTAFSGIDFFGSLGVPDSELNDRKKQGRGLLHKSRTGSLWYIREWMGQIREQYAKPALATCLYTDVRCGQVHEGIVKPGLLIGLRHKELHLRRLCLDGGTRGASLPDVGVLFVDTAVFADDFLRSSQVFLDTISHDDCLCQRALARLDEHLQQAVTDISGLGDAVNVGPAEFQELYETSSASPNDPGGYWLRDKLTVEHEASGSGSEAEQSAGADPAGRGAAQP
ncbi:MAG: hypothetical protein ABIF19_09720 [Planctomycetota bacterium]